MGRTIAIIFCSAALSGSAVYCIMHYQQRDKPPKERRNDREQSNRGGDPIILPSGIPFGPPEPAPELIDGKFQPIRLVPPRPAVSGWKAISAKEADGWLRPNETVLGVVVHGKPRAYPINALTGPDREIFNDELAGEPIAATW